MGLVLDPARAFDGAAAPTEAIPWRDMIELAEIGIFIVDHNRRMVLWNGWMERMSGVKTGAALGRPLTDLFPALGETRISKALEAALEDGIASFISHSLNNTPLPLTNPAKGEPVEQNTSLRPLAGGDGNRLCLVQIHDVSDSMRRERYLRQQSAEIRAARDQLEIINREKDKFFSIIAHDLRSPFTTLVGLTRAMAELGEQMSAKQLAAQAQIVNDSAKTVFNLLDNLLQWASLQMNGAVTEPIALRLRDVGQRSIDLFAASAAEKNIEMRNLVSAEATAFGDMNMIDTVIRNLANNALKFTPEGGAVTFESEVTIDGVELTVSDNGVGMTEEQLERLFGLDQKNTSPGTNGEKGTGLGLILCRDLVERNGGAIRVESAPGVGSAFTVLLPPTAGSP